MLSEWVIDPPEDLENQWVMVVCPEGKRLLVVAHKVNTVFLLSFQSVFLVRTMHLWIVVFFKDSQQVALIIFVIDNIVADFFHNCQIYEKLTSNSF